MKEKLLDILGAIVSTILVTAIISIIGCGILYVAMALTQLTFL